MSVRPRAVVLAVLTVAATLLALRVLESAGRVIGWVAMAAAIAAVLTPAVSALARRMPRGLAVAAVGLVSLGSIAVVGYGFVEDVVDQMQVLEEEAPRLAAELEESGRFAEAAREAELSDRVEGFVEKVPERLRGGTPADAVRSAATRGLAFLAVAVLTVFMVLHGPRLLDGARRQIRDDRRRELASRLTAAVERRAIGYARGMLASAALAGMVAYVFASTADVPGAAPLAVWVAIWDLVPLVGALVGAAPIIALGAILSPTRGLLLAAGFVA
ncbi:MAG TPA: AI-2E family transporter, partial [Acidimicrobiales bacterium]|nr:AI-2E family transporter [Acidimicrobiales bacterium]